MQVTNHINSLRIEKIGTIVFSGKLPSSNEFKSIAGRHRQAGSEFEKKWLATSMIVCQNWLNSEWPDGFSTLQSGVWVIVRAFRPNLINRDLTNIWVKPVFDAFTRCGIWKDDNEKVVPRVAFEYCGVDKSNPRIEFEIYQEQEDK